MKWLYSFAAAMWLVAGQIWVWREAPEMWVMCFAIAAVYVALLIRAWSDA